MSDVHLKIKAKALAAEAKIIRIEELKAKKCGDYELNRDLHDHRVFRVRMAARSTHLARAFLKGLMYKQIEAKCHEEPNRPEVLRLLERYGEGSDRSEVKRQLNEWFDKQG